MLTRVCGRCCLFLGNPTVPLYDDDVTLELHTHVVALKIGLRHAERGRLHASVSVDATAVAHSDGCSSKTALGMVSEQGQCVVLQSATNR